ncbi:conserved hypothetical protein, partial [Trichinella spiralis]|uniref:hypothetical protein n=1 Tax=Trichinella spiralis TaxID=6334 RepID=UPI0001EFD2E5
TSTIGQLETSRFVFSVTDIHCMLGCQSQIIICSNENPLKKEFFMDPLEKSVSGIAISIFSQQIVDFNMPYELDEMNIITLTMFITLHAISKIASNHPPN